MRAAGHKGRCLFVAHLHEANLVLAGAKGFDHAFDSIAQQPENEVHIPFEQTLDERHLTQSYSSMEAMARLHEQFVSRLNRDSE